jgi:hypothetical protein
VARVVEGGERDVAMEARKGREQASVEWIQEPHRNHLAGRKAVASLGRPLMTAICESTSGLPHWPLHLPFAF